MNKTIIWCKKPWNWQTLENANTETEALPTTWCPNAQKPLKQLNTVTYQIKATYWHAGVIKIIRSQVCWYYKAYKSVSRYFQTKNIPRPAVAHYSTTKKQKKNRQADKHGKVQEQTSREQNDWLVIKTDAAQSRCFYMFWTENWADI